MDAVEDIQNRISLLSREELSRFVEWLDQYQARRWDEQFESDVHAGRLDDLAEKALDDLKAGRCSEL